MKLKEKIEQERLALEYMEKELRCESCYFYNNGMLYKNIRSLSPQGWFADLQKVEPSIRIFGTQQQIDEALDTYIELTGLNLNECHEYQIEEEGSFHYNEKENIRIARNLKIYKELYDKQNNNKALITTI